MAWRSAFGAFGLLLAATSGAQMGSAQAADRLAAADGPLRITGSPLRVTLDRLRDGEPAAIVLSGPDGGRGGVLNLFLARPQPADRDRDRDRGAADPDYIGSASLFGAGPGRAVSVTVPPRLRPALSQGAPVIEIVPVGDTPATVTLEGVHLLGR